MFSKFFFLFAFLLGTMFSFVACSGGDEDEPALTPATNTPTTDLNSLSPEAQKQNLENIGTSLANEIKPADFQQLVIALEDFNSNASNSSLRSAKLRSTTASLRSVVATSDLNQMSSMLRSVSTNDYYTKYYATYTYKPATAKWDSTANSTALVCKYMSQGKEAEMSVQVSSEYFSFVEQSETIYVPKVFTYTMKLGGTTMMTYSISVSNFNRTTGVVIMNSELSIPSANLKWYASTDISSTRSSVLAGVKKGTANLIAASAEVNGSNLSSTSVDPTVNKATMKINLMDKMYYTVECPDFAAYEAGLTQIGGRSECKTIDTYSYEPNANGSTYKWGTYRPEPYYKAQSSLMNQYFLGYFNFDNSTTQVAKLYFDYKYDVVSSQDSHTYTDYYYPSQTYTYTYIDTHDNSEILPGIQFTSDGSKYKYFDYFNENNFASFFKTFQDLGNGFAGLVTE